MNLGTTSNKHLALTLGGLGLALFALGCGDDSNPAKVDGGIVDGGGDSGGDGSVAAAACPADTLCLAVKPTVAGKTVKAGRLVIPWVQSTWLFNPIPVQIAYDVAFDGSKSRIDIPLKDIKVPDVDGVFVCNRNLSLCGDGAGTSSVGECPCLESLKIALGGVILSDGDAPLAAADLLTKAKIGESKSVGPAYSSATLTNAQFATATLPADTKTRLQAQFPQGITQMIKLYEANGSATIGSGSPTVTVTKLVPAAAGKIFDLNVCVKEEATCTLPQ